MCNIPTQRRFSVAKASQVVYIWEQKVATQVFSGAQIDRCNTPVICVVIVIFQNYTFSDEFRISTLGLKSFQSSFSRFSCPRLFLHNFFKNKSSSKRNITTKSRFVSVPGNLPHYYHMLRYFAYNNRLF